jgi:AbiV family abortive infection protein
LSEERSGQIGLYIGGKNSMSTEDFKNASKEVLLNGAKLCYQNAEDLYRCGNASLEISKPNIATSLYILCVEEAIKSMVLLAGYVGYPVNFEIEPVFSDHGPKHKHAGQMQLFIRTLGSLRGMFGSQNSVRSQLSALLDIYALAGSDVKQLRNDEKRWWAKANSFKNLGLYVNYSNGWPSRQRIPDEFAQETKEKARSFVKALGLVERLRIDDYKLIPDELIKSWSEKVKSMENEE